MPVRPDGFALPFAALPLSILLAAAAAAQSTSLVSALNGTPGNSDSTLASGGGRSVTPDGRFVVFTSSASNLVAGDTLGWPDVFLLDRTTGAIERISATTGGEEPDAPSFDGVVSDDGRFVAFASDAANLAAGDFNFATDVFVRDRTTGVVTIASASSAGEIGDAASSRPTISGDGLRIAFQSAATNLVPGDVNGRVDVFLRNQATNKVRLVTTGPAGAADGDCFAPSISANGRWIAFESTATNLVAGDALAFREILLFDFTDGSLERVSVDAAGLEADGDCGEPTVSRDGGLVAFSSVATDLGAASGRHVYVRDLALATTTLIDATAQGAAGNGDASRPVLSANGTYVAYLSRSTNLVPNDTGDVADVYVTSLAIDMHQRASVTTGLGTVDPSQPIEAIGGLSDDARFVAFASEAANLVPGDLGGFSDVFLRDLQRPWHADADGDGYGDPAVFQLASFPPAGHVGDSTDCDDGSAAVHPGATEICNGIDDDCDLAVDENVWTAFCDTSTSQNGCEPHMSASGVPSASASSGFTLRIDGLDGLRAATVVYGLQPTQVVWAFGSTSTRCVRFPWGRTVTSSTGGVSGQCNGLYVLDWIAYMAANPGALGQPLTPGEQFYAQGWYRDFGAAKHSNLSDAIAFSICP